MGVYYPLEQSDSIRLVVLHPAIHSRYEVHCDLQNISLSSIPKDEASSYITLSYTWGNSKPSKHIFIHGEKFEVGPNLFSALQNIRRRDHSIRLWVDAICINQEDLDERSQQVQQMREIYASASETVIYLGPDDKSVACRNAWNFLEHRSLWAMNDHKDLDRTLPKARRNDVNFKTGYNDVLSAVMSREWFSRIWVIQEVVVSQQLSIQCGGRRIPWDSFCRTLFLYFRPLQWKDGISPQNDQYSKALKSLQDLMSVSDITDLRPGWEVVSQNNPGWEGLIQPVKELCQTRLLFQREHKDVNVLLPKWVLNDPLAEFVTDDTEFRSGSLRLPHLLAKYRKFHATDARDKALALLGISNVSRHLRSEEVEKIIDYKDPDDQVFRNVTRLIMAAEQSFDILSQVGQTTIPEDLNFSSWAGKWNERDFPPVAALNRLGGEPTELKDLRKSTVSKHYTWSDDGKILACTGGIMGELVATGPLNMSSSGAEGLYKDSGLWLHNEFKVAASSLIESTTWSFVRRDTVFRTAKITDTLARGSFFVTASTGGESPIEKVFCCGGGSGFLDDAYALQEGRMLGLVRSVSQSLPQELADEQAAYNWAIVPKWAEVGDKVATMTGCRVLFLVHQQPQDKSEDRTAMEKGFRAKLPRDGEKDCQIMHCRLRGECRVSGFEDMWQPWEMDEKLPLMTYGGYHPVEWQSRIFAFH